jgi:hypothetical protein
VHPAINAVEAGIYAREQLIYSGKLKAFTSFGSWYLEFRLYRRDQQGKIVKEGDHLMDPMRYLVMADANGLQKSARPEVPVYEYRTWAEGEQRWMH